MSPERWQQIEELFQAAVELPITDRKEFLDAKCGSDTELRLQVERLLASDDSAEEFIESPIWTDSSFLNTSAKKEISDSFEKSVEGAAVDNYLGRVIGAFRLEKEIGRGGMGAVYLAERADGEFQQRVAVKLIKRGMDSDFIIRRFRHERQILASFEHPFIARLLDGGTTSDGVPYFVMEYVEGQTFYNYSDANRLTIRERLKIFQKVCSALEYAHSRQIIHRDIKPSNILIDRTGSPKLLDFGIAKILDPNLIHESLNPTASMLRMMTPDYASPEQVQGADVTQSSDIYSLGVLLYEFLTGHRPYNFAGRALQEVSHVICNTMPKVPSRIIKYRENLLPHYVNRNGDFLEARKTTATDLAAELGRDLDDIVMKALSKEPSNRYSSVAELSKDISRHLNGAKVFAPKYSPQAASRTEALPRLPANTKSLAVLPFSFLNLVSSEDTDDRFLGMGLADALITRLSKVKRFVVRPTSSITSFGDGPIDPVAAGRELNVDFILNGSIKKANDRLRVTVQLLYVAQNAAIWATSIDEELADVFSLEDKLAAKVVDGLLPQLTSDERDEFVKRGTDDPEAFEHYLRGRYYFNSFTEESFAKAFVSFHSAIAADPNYAHAYAGIADYYNWLGIMGVLPPQECFLPAIDAAKRAVELDENLSEAHASLGFSLHAGNYEWSRAEHHLMRAMELNPSNSNAFVWYSIVMFTEGRFAEGLKYAQRGVEIDPLAPFNHHNIAWGCYYARRFDEAAAGYRKVIADFPDYSFGYYGLSKVLRIKGDTTAAIRENARAIELMGNSMFSLLSEAECYAADGQRAVALKKIAGLERQSAERYVSPYQLSLVYCYLGEREMAIAQLQKASEIKEAWLNWAAVDPVFDTLRGDPRFEAIIEKTGYRPFFSSFSAINSSPPAEVQRPQDVHNLTTLVIEDSDTESDETIRLSPWRRPKIYIIATLAAVVLVSLVALGIHVHQAMTSPAPAAARVVASSIVVLPFTSSDAASSDIGNGLSDALSNKLGNIKSLQVISANTGRSLSSADPTNLDTELGIAYVLRGSISRDGNSVSADAELWDTRAGNIIFHEEFTVPDGNLFTLQTRLAEKVWTALGIDPLPIERRQVERSYTDSIQAYQLYLRGRSEMTNRSVESLTSAASTFSSSIREDPNFALAYVGLADVLSLLNLYSVAPPTSSYAEAKKNVTRALELDPDLAEAHATLGYIKFFHDRDRPGSELEFRRAIQVNPSYAPAHHWFALTLAAKGEKANAETEIVVAKRLDPQSAAIRAAAGVVHFQLGDLAQAINESDAAIAHDVRSIPAYKVKRWAYTTMGDRGLAETAFAKEMELSGGTVQEAGWKIIKVQVDSIGGERQSLRRTIDECLREPSIRNNPSGFAYEIALAFNSLGESVSAIEWLERSEAAGGHSFNYAAVDPRLANLREEPRFVALLKKLR
ncbi:MAG TPA: protein kinase [Pyrinomonadaceae bacterium]|nr:protein kinase [Pyrinomonadaceae bacterium]